MFLDPTDACAKLGAAMPPVPSFRGVRFARLNRILRVLHYTRHAIRSARSSFGATKQDI